MDLENRNSLTLICKLLLPIGELPMEESIYNLARLFRESVKLSGLLLIHYHRTKKELKAVIWNEKLEKAFYMEEDRVSTWRNWIQESVKTGKEKILKDIVSQEEGRVQVFYPLSWPKDTGYVLIGTGLGQAEPDETEKMMEIERFLSFIFHKNNLNSWVFEEIMNRVKMNLYITDIKTDKILFMNNAMKQDYGLVDPEGKVCWKVIQKDMDERCPFCPMDKLLESKEESPSYLWEEHSSVNNRIYENYDCLIRWIDGKEAHFHQAIDVTEQRKLTQTAAIDELTGLFNRRGGKIEAKKTLREIRQCKRPGTFCMFDLNDLKKVNDTYGHAEGDEFIIQVAKGVKDNLKQGEYALRLSGDEFIIVFPNCKEAEADQKLKDILVHLEKVKKKKRKKYDLGFCYGLLEVRGDEDYLLRDIFRTLDERMYVRKRQHHIKLAEERLKREDQKFNIEDFRFDKEQMYDALAKSMNEYIFICDMKTGLYRYPKALVEEFNLPGEVIRDAGVVWENIIHESDRKGYQEANENAFRGVSPTYHVEYRAANREGDWVWLRCRGHIEKDKDGKPALLAGIITHLGKENSMDLLTGLGNKFECEVQVQEYLKDGKDSPFGFVLLGLDGFKKINNLYDRTFGDKVIQTVAQNILTMIPSKASVFRCDGDEFAILFPEGVREEIESFYQKIQEVYSKQHSYNNKKFYSSISGGCAFYPKDGKCFQELMKNAEFSLTCAKRKGRNRLIFFTHDIMENEEKALQLARLLRESIDNQFEGFQLYYQPLIQAGTKRVCGAEALIRWKCEELGMVSPTEMIPILEENLLIIPLGKWILRQASLTKERWRKANPDLYISVNLSYIQLEDPSFLDYIEKEIEEHYIDPSYLVLELTESYLATNFERMQKRLDSLRKMGFRLAMDDFGTGYSSLSILKKFQMDIVKIDRTFTQDILESCFDKNFIRFTAELCHNVNMRVCLEGVETEEQMEVMEQMGLDLYQGFFFGRPSEEKEFEKFIAKREDD